jgi:dihydrofolate synthase/folylpolyglutamate synthase
VAHITGTSGKGSTATFLERIMQAYGWRAGLYTNPYITIPQERVQLAGVPIGDADLCAVTAEVAAAIDRLAARRLEWRPHLKQVWVAVALLAFARAGVELAVIEVGMGGRYDETNAVTPAIAIITTIGLDHTEFLGPTRQDIAWHKAGIIKPGAPVITGVTDSAALAVIQAEAAQTESPLDVLGRDFTIAHIRSDAAGATFDYADALGAIPAAHTRLAGEHQALNAALAIRAARVLAPDIAAPVVRTGVAAAWLPGRFEIIDRRPLVILDAAHNPDKMQALRYTLEAVLPNRAFWVIFGAMGSKAVGPMLTDLARIQPRLLLVEPQVAGRQAAPSGDILASAQAAGITDCAIYPSPRAALAAAHAHAAPDDVILITGSLFLVSQLRPLVVDG